VREIKTHTGWNRSRHQLWPPPIVRWRVAVKISGRHSLASSSQQSHPIPAISNWAQVQRPPVRRVSPRDRSRGRGQVSKQGATTWDMTSTCQALVTPKDSEVDLTGGTKPPSLLNHVKPVGALLRPWVSPLGPGSWTCEATSANHGLCLGSEASNVSLFTWELDPRRGRGQAVVLCCSSSSGVRQGGLARLEPRMSTKCDHQMQDCIMSELPKLELRKARKIRVLEEAGPCMPVGPFMCVVRLRHRCSTIGPRRRPRRAFLDVTRRSPTNFANRA